MTLDEDAMRAGIAIHCAVAERFLAPANLREICHALRKVRVITSKRTVGSVVGPSGRLAQLARALPSHG